MLQKAEENRRAAHLLLDSEHYNAAANRLYYMVFQSAIAILEKQGKKPTDFDISVKKWRHETIKSNAFCIRENEYDKNLLRDLVSLREVADYQSDAVERDELEALWQDAINFYGEATNGQLQVSTTS